MKLSQTVSTPYKATVHFLSYITRKANRDMQMVFANAEGVDVAAAQQKMQDILKLKDLKEKTKQFLAIPKEEKKILFEIQDTMVTRMLDKIVKEDKTVLEESEYKRFFERMDDEDFAKLGETASAIVTSVREKSEKKTKE